MKVTMIGTGYVGLVSGVCFADMGHDVTCIDTNVKIIEMLKEGLSPIYEPGLSEMIQKNYRNKSVNFSTDYDSVGDADIVFLGVGTPSRLDGSANLNYLTEATISTGKALKKDGVIIVIKSTVPLGTHEKVIETLSQHTDKKFCVVNNPEFLKEGSAIDDFMRPDRVVVGHKETEAATVMEELYAPLVKQGHPIHFMSNISAEMTKYASNSLLATKISFINDIAKLCDRVGADIEQVRSGMASDKRIGPHFIYAGPGYGGSCFPKDVKALIKTGNDLGVDLKVVKAVEEVNLNQKIYMFQKIKKHFNGQLKDKIFSFWGVSFKPNTDDIRETPAVNMALALIREGAKIKFYDPEASQNFEKFIREFDIVRSDSIISCTDKYECLEDSDALVLITEWTEFKVPSLDNIKHRLRHPNIFDCRNIFPKDKVLSMGFAYYAIGRYIEKNNI